MLQLWHKTSVLISASQHQSNPSAVRMNAGNFYLMLALLFSLDLYCQLFQSLRRSRVLPNPQPRSYGERNTLWTLSLQETACFVKVTERKCSLSYKINWQTQGLQIHYGFLYSATVDVKMDTSQEQENVPLPIRFCFLLISYFLVQTTLSNSASSCCYPWNISEKTRSLTTPSLNPLELLGLLHHRSQFLCQGIVVNQKILLETRKKRGRNIIQNWVISSNTMLNSFCSRSADTGTQGKSDSVDASQTVDVR